jgi:hypothetical protein
MILSDFKWKFCGRTTANKDRELYVARETEGTDIFLES